MGSSLQLMVAPEQRGWGQPPPRGARADLGVEEGGGDPDVGDGTFKGPPPCTLHTRQ